MTVEQNCANPGQGGAASRRALEEVCHVIMLVSGCGAHCQSAVCFIPSIVCARTLTGPWPCLTSSQPSNTAQNLADCWLPPGTQTYCISSGRTCHSLKKKGGGAQTYLNYKEITTKQTTSFLFFLEHLNAICFHFYILRGNHGRFDG